MDSTEKIITLQLQRVKQFIVQLMHTTLKSKSY